MAALFFFGYHGPTLYLWTLSMKKTPLVVRKAVLPVAGLGTRMLPATKAIPKEMLPVVDKPLIQYAVEEAVAAGITDLIFVTGRHKRAIEDHFDSAPEMEAELARKGKIELLEIVQGILPANVSCIYIRQSAPLGLGHAVLTAAPIVGDEPFAVLLADDLLDADRPVIGQLIDAALTHQEVKHRQMVTIGRVFGRLREACVRSGQQVHPGRIPFRPDSKHRPWRRTPWCPS